MLLLDALLTHRRGAQVCHYLKVLWLSCTCTYKWMDLNWQYDDSEHESLTDAPQIMQVLELNNYNLTCNIDSRNQTIRSHLEKKHKAAGSNHEH